MTDIRRAKRELRRASEAARAAAHAAGGAAAAQAVAASFLAVFAPRPGQRVSAYWPMNAELDVRPLLERLDALGATCLLPVIAEKGGVLSFARWRPGDALVAGVAGIAEPGPAAERADPELAIVPLLAFDRHGNRLGYGGGYYDRTLAALRARGPVLAAGVAFAAQEVESVPTTGSDQKLDWIVTERGARRCGAVAP